ncbi:type I polyketide synthase [Falsiroseomonas stagni]|uniref:Acyl transferase domain-containing protein n=1 Tax=Falsiroseomonas stagni DSM 19981 TaxID=1123062 RepID=A0A1I4D7B9_9PROT|nr:type I polyketide synthase [Falsiroseomonas stagni]SFK88739.1 Acyl transferase domain-containing protein [Falsiroseomonas stagni DSM 19981]
MICAPEQGLDVRGLAVRLPGAPTLDAFWSLLRDGRCSVADSVPAGRWRPERFLSPDRAARGTAYTFAGGYLDDIFAFDAAAFGFSPREAAQTDPQQRVLLEVVWEALEDAGIAPSSLARRQVGVFVGASATDYANVPLLDLGAIGAHFMVGNSLSILANRVSYVFDLRGPSMTLDTACSSSLVALHQAAVALERGEVELAIVAGVNILSSPAPFVGFSRAGMLSPTGRCRPFAAAADGYVRAEGAVALVLGRAGAAGPLPARARLRAVGVNSDGRKNGIAFPSAEGQRALLAATYAQAAISPRSLSFVEAHGTGTAVGDPVEARAIGEALGQQRDQRLPVGSVKSNIGHLEAVSGLAGLAKAVLALGHRHLPATLHLDATNPAIDVAALNLAPASQALDLPVEGTLLAGVCNYGFGGTNAHAILEGPGPADAASAAGEAPDLLIVSAPTREGLSRLAAAYAAAVDRRGVAAVAGAAAASRDLLRHRLVIDLAEVQDPAAALRGTAPGARMAEALVPRARIGFVFTGNGCQYAGMALEALERSAPFRESVEATAALIREAGGVCPLETLNAGDAEERLAATTAAQTALYAIQMGLVDALAAQGLRPALVLGHSVGEVAAAAAAGILGRAQAAHLIVARSACQEAIRGLGRMAVLGCDAARARALAEALAREEGASPAARVEVAAENGPASTTISGPAAAIRAVMAAARREAIPSVLLDIDYPFHHALLEPERETILQALARLAPVAGRVPMISAVTGDVASGAMLDAAYWWDNIRSPVLFAPAMAAALDHADLFIEIGPRPLLGSAMGDVARRAGRAVGIMGSLAMSPPVAADPVRAIVAEAVARGATPRFWGTGRGSRILPPMAWNRGHFVIDRTPEAYSLYEGEPGTAGCHPLAGTRMAPGGTEWRHALSLETVPFLAGHRVDGQVVLPATGFIEMMAAVAEQVLGTARLRLNDLDILRALVLEPGVTREVSVTFDAAEQMIAVRSRPRSDHGDPFVLHARAAVQILAGEVPAVAVPAAEGAGLGAEAVYAAAARARLDYSGAFRAVTALHRCPGGFVAALDGPAPDLGAFPPVMVTDPAAFDAALHGLFLDLLPAPNVTAGELPVRVGRLSLFGPRTPIARSVVRVIRRTRNTRVVDVDFLAADDGLVARVEGGVMRRVVFAAWRDEDRIILPFDHDEPARQASLRDHGALPAVVAGPVSGPADWAVAVATFLVRGIAGSGPIPMEEPPVPEAARPLWHAMLEMLRERGALSADGGLREAPAPEAALRDLLRRSPEAVADLRAASSAMDRLGVFLDSGVAAVPEAGDGWLARSRLVAPTMEAVAAAILDRAAPGAPLRVALLEPGLEGLLPRLLPALREGRLALEVLTATPRRAEAVLARAGARGLVGVRDAAETPAAPPDLAACVVVLPLDATPSLPLRQLQALRGAVPIILGVPPHDPVIDLLHGAEEGWWSLTADPRAPVGQWPLPAETREAALAAGLGPLLDETLDDGGAGLMLFAARTVPEPMPAAALPALHVRPGAMARARALLPGCELVPLTGGLPGVAPGAVVLDLEAGPVAGERAALRDRILRLRDLAQGLGGHRLRVLCEGDGALSDATVAVVRSLANEYQDVDIGVLRMADGAAPGGIAAALGDHLASPERDIRLGAGGATVARLRRGRPASRAPGPGERTVLAQAGAGIDGLGWVIAPREAPGAGEVEVAVAATGLNFRDVMLALGLLDEEILGEGLTGGSLGFEFSGQVLRAGPGVPDHLQPGTAVVGFAENAFASHLVVRAAQLLPVPRALSIEAAAALPVAATTAWHALVDRAGLRAGETVLIHGGAGAVGLAALGIARARGARVIAAAGTPEKRALLLRLGADAVVDSRAADFEDRVRAVTDGVDVVLNSVAGEAMRATLRLVRPFGRFVELGKRDFLENTRIGLRPFARNIAFIGVDLDQLLAHAPATALEAAAAALGAVQQGTHPPLPVLVLDGAAAGDAFRLMQASGHVGKIVVRPASQGVARPPGTFEAAPGLHVVLGGTGGFGLAIAFWLAERGAKAILVASRRGAVDAAAMPRIEALRAQGLRFEVAAMDVTDAAALADAMARWRKAYGRIAGIVHTAMVLEDGLLSGVAAETLDRVLAPKVDGIRAVGAALAGDALQYLVACSSVTTMVGSPGQGAYVAANGFLEGAVREMRGRGLPAIAVCWGAIADSGVIARTRGLAERLRAATGVAGITTAEALDHLGRLLGNPAAAPAVSAYTVAHWAPGARGLATLRSPIFSELFAAGAQEEAAGGALLDLARLPREEAAERLLDAVREEVGRILRMPVEEVDADRNLIDLGLDSLMALELRMALEKRTGAAMTGLAALGGGQSARQLVHRLLPSLLGAEAEGDAGAPARPAAGGAAEPVAGAVRA